MEAALVFDGLAQGLELLGAERDRNGFSCDLAGPLITGARAPERGSIQDRALADITGAGKAGAQAFVLASQGIDGDNFLFHGFILTLLPSQDKYIYW